MQGLINVLKGKKYKNKPSRTRLFPSETLSNKLREYALEQEQPIEGPYLTINETDDIWEETMFKSRTGKDRHYIKVKPQVAKTFALLPPSDNPYLTFTA